METEPLAMLLVLGMVPMFVLGYLVSVSEELMRSSDMSLADALGHAVRILLDKFRR